MVVGARGGAGCLPCGDQEAGAAFKSLLWHARSHLLKFPITSQMASASEDKSFNTRAYRKYSVWNPHQNISNQTYLAITYPWSIILCGGQLCSRYSPWHFSCLAVWILIYITPSLYLRPLIPSSDFGFCLFLARLTFGRARELVSMTTDPSKLLLWKPPSW